jgi:hypothetical protein
MPRNHEPRVLWSVQTAQPVSTEVPTSQP